MTREKLDDALDTIKCMIQSRPDLALMSSDILELTHVLEEKEEDVVENSNDQKYKLYLDNSRENFIELEHEQMALMVKDALRTNLQEWLNKHLPDIVKKEVKEQIQLLIAGNDEG